MRSVRPAIVVASAALLAGCAGAGADAPADASDDQLVDLATDGAAEMARVGTPDNMSEDARVGFERFVERVGDLESGDVRDGSFNWQDENWENVEETSFADYVTNTCP